MKINGPPKPSGRASGIQDSCQRYMRKTRHVKKLQGIRIEYTPGQTQYLKNRAIKAKEEETCCDCPGCDTCPGFQRNCTCDSDWEALRAARR